MGYWTDKELIDAPVELLDEKDIVRQRKLQAKRAHKLALKEERAEKAKESASKRLVRAFRGKPSKEPFADLDITGAEQNF